MKNIALYFVLGTLIFTSCNSDDDSTPLPNTGVPDGVGNVVINEVNYGDDNLIELLNNGDASINLASYWLCLGPGRYLNIGSTTPVSGSIELGAGEFLVINWSQLRDSEGLGLYSTDSFTSSDAIVDFVQWAAGGSARENVAVAAGIWTAGDFVEAVTTTTASISFDGNGNTASNWSETTSTSFGNPNVIPPNL
ncbi:hypothetical protein [Aquimarina sp. 2304DJ70-9]|uniref:hypothetical protein n=1 Tax=Aquimarina penaris TaxID=3231044 RepID=UPI003462544A